MSARPTIRPAVATFVAAALALAAPAARGALANAGFESPDASGGDVPGTATGWTGSFNANYITDDHARTGTQSLKQFGNDAGQYQTFAAAPDQFWSASVWVMTPTGDKLSGGAAAFLQIQFLNASQQVIATAASGVPALDSTSPADTWVLASLPDAASVPGTAFARIMLFSGPYSGQPGITGGAAFFDDASFENTTPVPEPAGFALASAAAVLVTRRRRRPV